MERIYYDGIDTYFIVVDKVVVMESGIVQQEAHIKEDVLRFLELVWEAG